MHKGEEEHGLIRTMSAVISLPTRKVLTHNLSRVANLFLGSSSNVLYNIASKLSSLANIAKSVASR